MPGLADRFRLGPGSGVPNLPGWSSRSSTPRVGYSRQATSYNGEGTVAALPQPAQRAEAYTRAETGPRGRAARPGSSEGTLGTWDARTGGLRKDMTDWLARGRGRASTRRDVAMSTSAAEDFGERPRRDTTTGDREDAYPGRRGLDDQGRASAREHHRVRRPPHGARRYGERGRCGCKRRVVKPADLVAHIEVDAVDAGMPE